MNASTDPDLGTWTYSYDVLGELTVDEVIRGDREGAFVTKEFASKTGIEAYRSSPDSKTQPIIRDTFSVGVFIVRDPIATAGFRVITAYPRQ